MEKKNSDGEAFPRPRRVERTFPSPHARGSPHLHRVAWHSLFAQALGIHFFAQATGIDAVVLYSPRIFEKAGIKSDNYRLLATVAVGFVRTVSILVATFLLDRGGWRVLFLSSVSGLRLSLLTLGLSLTVEDHSRTTLTWAAGLSIGAAITIGGAFFLFAGVAVAAWIFHYTLLPEISGKTLEEIEKSFGNFFGKPKEEAEGVVDYNGEIQLKTCDQTLTSVD
ncbi:Polyol transporter 5 [Glycine soja]|nr:Polyol transporter 5 [Glycine soja]